MRKIILVHNSKIGVVVPGGRRMLFARGWNDNVRSYARWNVYNELALKRRMVR